MTPSNLRIVISVSLEGADGEQINWKRESQTFEGAEEDLGKLERAVEKKLSETPIPDVNEEF